MFTEDYVSFEIAKLLEEKGFDWIVERSFLEHDNCYAPCDPSEIQRKDAIAIPTLQMAMKWLREVHNLHCAVDYDYVLGWYCQITSLKETIEYDYEEMKHYHPDNDHDFSSAEEAYDAAIKYCLENLI